MSTTSHTRRASPCHRLKEWLRGYPRLFRLAKEILIGGKILRRRIRNLGQRENRVFPLQPPTRVALPLSLGDGGSLQEFLRGLELRFEEGRHTCYCPPQPGLKKLGLAADHPVPVGLKLLKQPGGLDEAGYLREADTRAARSILGGIANQAESAACLAALDLGPDFVDLAEMELEDSRLSALCVEHVEGRVPEAAEYEAFMEGLRDLRRRGVFTLANPSGFDCGDFEGPDCNRNLWMDAAGRPRYVDSQLFLFDPARVLDELLHRAQATLHFGSTSRILSEDGAFLYQDIPGFERRGKRGTGQRWRTIEALLAECEISLDGWPVFDICCNSGMMLAQSLSRGALRGYGWDLPEVVAVARPLLQLLGAGRVSLQGAQLGEGYDFRADLPAELGDGGTAFFLAAWQHIGVPATIGDLPWTSLVYEGHQDDDRATTERVFREMREKWGCRLAAETRVSDGLSDKRPLALFGR